MFKPNLTVEQENQLLALASKTEKDRDKTDAYTFKKLSELHNKLNNINKQIDEYEQHIEELKAIGAKTVGAYEATVEAYIELVNDENDEDPETEDQNISERS